VPLRHTGLELDFGSPRGSSDARVASVAGPSPNTISDLLKGFGSTRMGLQAARERGRIGERKPQLKPSQRAEIIGMVKSGSKSAAEAARLFNLHRSTISRLLAMERFSAQ
jgi:plasmid maintenance system antidote protein VapI